MFRFDIAISYAGEEEGIAEDLFKLLQDKKVNVFFAKDEQSYLLGKPQKQEYKFIFATDTKFVVPIISKNYVHKDWPKYEFKIAKEEDHKRYVDFILPIRIDDNILEGLKEDISYIDLRKKGIFRTVDIIFNKLKEVYPIEEVIVPKVWVTTFGLVIDDIIENYKLPPSAPHDYPHLCDWLEKDLMNRLSKSQLETTYILEDSRDGETLSVRIGFKWDSNKNPLDFGNISWWEVLEITEFNEIYPDQNLNEIFREK